MLKFRLVCITIFLTIYSSVAQNFQEKFSNVLASNNMNSLRKLYDMSQRGNSFSFMQLSYSVDANNTMYESTSEKRYLDYNLEIIRRLMNSGEKDVLNPELQYSRRWIATIPKGNVNANMNQKEVSLFEGYLFRHLAKSAYLINTNKEYSVRVKNEVTSFVEDYFFRIYKQSIQTEGDLSLIHSIRTHMGSHWVMMALFLKKISTNVSNVDIYKNAISVYNQALKKNFKLIKGEGVYFYQWNSTWDQPFTSYQKRRKRKGIDRTEIQDVSHGNQVVEYIIASYKLGYPDWTKKDLTYLINTLTYKVWISKGIFADNIDGARGNHQRDLGSGYKQSLGWMKLMNFDSTGSLYKRYKNYYNDNQAFIDSMYLNLQYYANFVSYESSR